MLSVLIIEGVGGMGGGGGMGCGKNHQLGHPMSSHDAHSVANGTVRSGPHNQWEQTQVPNAQLAPSMHSIVPASHDFGGLAKCPSQQHTG